MPLFQRRAGFGQANYPFNLPTAKDVKYQKGDCPVVERMHEEEIFFHDMMHANITKKDLDDVVAAFKKVYDHRHELKQ
jgi:dTDP-4-amino-4,6-dideoxygalactose transaminase